MFFSWRPYVSVAARREKARAMAAKLRKKGQEICPVEIEGRTIARTFWGKAWCDHMESYSDFENRLPRGRTYVRNGSVFDLQIEPGKVRALVSGSAVYKVDIFITPAEDRHWKKLVRDCAGQIDSVIELLQGKFSKGVMEVLADRQNGLFPTPREIKFKCSCPDSAHMCKHIAAVLYGTGARLDHDPALLFRLRQVDESELVSQAAKGLGRGKLAAPVGLQTLESTDLGAVFGIDLDSNESSVPEKKTRARKQAAKKRTREPIKKSAKPVSRRSMPSRQPPLDQRDGVESQKPLQWQAQARSDAWLRRQALA